MAHKKRKQRSRVFKPSDISVSLEIFSEDETYMAYICNIIDISKTGICLMIKAKFPAPSNNLYRIKLRHKVHGLCSLNAEAVRDFGSLTYGRSKKENPSSTIALKFVDVDPRQEVFLGLLGI